MEGQDAAEPQAGFLAGVGAFPFCPLPTIHTSLFWKSAVMKDRDLDGYWSGLLLRGCGRCWLFLKQCLVHYLVPAAGCAGALVLHVTPEVRMVSTGHLEGHDITQRTLEKDERFLEILGLMCVSRMRNTAAVWADDIKVLQLISKVAADT